MRKISTLLSFCISVCLVTRAQSLDDKHNPTLDLNLSPAHNNAIDPERNSVINPKYNWNLNPLKNGLLNPEKNLAINPQKNGSLNPVARNEMNPMFTMNLSPRYNLWRGQFLFSRSDELVGYVTVYSQEVILQFDKDANWNFFYVRTARGTYNQFNLQGEWTGCYICYDSRVGYNLFNKDGEWTGMHIK